ncbi:hypothetical protein J2Y02_004226 [Neobacillus drentensis]|nr:hypothetical protein [Neobacillus drentensis]
MIFQNSLAMGGEIYGKNLRIAIWDGDGQDR